MIIITTTLSAMVLTTFVVTYILLAGIGAYTLTGWLISKFTKKNIKPLRIESPFPGVIYVNKSGKIVYNKDTI